MTGIYQIRNTINGKRYIGQSVDIEKRWQREARTVSPSVNAHLLRAFQKYGLDAFKFDVLCLCTEEELSELECLLIEVLETYKPENGYNKTLGGDGWGRPTEENRKKHSLRMRGTGNPNYGKPHTEEHLRKMRGRKCTPEAVRKLVEFNKQRIVSDVSRARMSASQIGRKHSEETKHKIASKHLGKKKSAETRARIAKSKEGVYVGAKNPRARAVLQYTLEGAFLREFACIKYAAQACGKSPVCIKRALVEHIPQAHGYTWKYKIIK